MRSVPAALASLGPGLCVWDAHHSHDRFQEAAPCHPFSPWDVGYCCFWLKELFEELS